MARLVFGHVPGVVSGTWFRDRRALHEAGVHRPLQAGISGNSVDGADSIVISGGYEDDEDQGDTVLYTGHGGRDQQTGKQIADQMLQAGNKALALSCDLQRPVRVIRGPGRHSRYAPTSGYRYDGLYRVTRFWPETGKSGYRVYRYELEQLRDQELPNDKAGDPYGLGGTLFGPTSTGGSPVHEERLRRSRSGSLSLDPPTRAHSADVLAALDLAAGAMRTVVQDLGQTLKTATEGGHYQDARQLLDLAEKISACQAQLSELASKWKQVSQSVRRPRGGSAQRGHKKRDYGRVAPGDKTPQHHFRIPILQALADLGGRAPAHEVLAQLEQRLGPSFRRADTESLPSDPRELRWRNTAQWARLQLVREGLMLRSEERGMWEISPAGRALLESHDASG